MKTSPRRNPREVYVLKKTDCARRIFAGIFVTLSTLFLAGCVGLSTSKPPSKVIIPGSQTYSISGTISPASVGSGASVALSGPTQATTKADSSGKFSFNDLVDGAYTLSVSKSGIRVNPSSQPVTVSGASVAQIAFSASVPTFSISGTISPAAAGSGAIVTISGGVNGSTTADGSGNYTFSNLDPGSYTVSPSKTGATFSPASQAVTVSSANVQVNFSGTVQTPTYGISGTISPVALGSGATVTLSGAANAVIVSNSSGTFTFGGLSNGSYTVSIAKSGVNMSPTSQQVTVSNANVSQVNFSASLPPTYSISGTISPTPAGSGATVTLSGSANASTISNGAGNYSFSGLSNGSYTVSVSKSGVNLSPGSQGVTVSNANVTQVNFSAIIPTFTVSGTISPASSGSGTTVTISGGVNASTTADSSGNYSFTNVFAGSYTLTPSKTGFGFNPSARNVNVNTNVSGISFTAQAAGQHSGPIVINGQNGTVIQGLSITSTTGDCVTITNSTNITIENSEIGPCAGNGIKIIGGDGISIYDSYIHPETQAVGCCDTNDGIFANGGTQHLTIQGNVIAYGETNIEVSGGNMVSVVGNFLLNPRGPSSRGQNFQCWNNCSSVTVQNNYALSSQNTALYLYPENALDSINFGRSSGFVVQGNFISGGHSSSGCGIMADTFANNGQILNNRLLNTGQCGIGLTDGSHIADGNMVYNTNPVNRGGNTAMYAAHYGKSSSCGPMTITNNIADEIKQDGSHSGWWTDGTCGPVNLTTDTLNVPADPMLTPTSTVFAPPLIPPQPKNCVAVSPYSTQSSMSTCVP